MPGFIGGRIFELRERAVQVGARIYHVPLVGECRTGAYSGEDEGEKKDGYDETGLCYVHWFQNLRIG